MKTKYIIIGKRGNLAKAITKVLEASHGTNSFISLSSEEVISYLKQNNSYVSTKNDDYLEFIWCSGTSKARSSKENCEIDFFSFNGFIEVIRKMKINNSYLDGIETEYKLYHKKIINDNLKQIDLLKILLQTLEETSISPSLTNYKQREIEKDKKNIKYQILELEQQLF